MKLFLKQHFNVLEVFKRKDTTLEDNGYQGFPIARSPSKWNEGEVGRRGVRE